MAIRITFETVDVQGAESLTPIKILTYDSKGSGITAAGKQALLDLLEKVAYIDQNGQTYLDALEAALFPPANLVSITAVYTQTSSVFAGDDLDDLKDDLVITAHYDDGASEVVATYTLSGELEENPSIITVSYGGKTTTFSVPLVAVSSISAVYTQSGAVFEGDSLNDVIKPDLVVTATMSDQSTRVLSEDEYGLTGTLASGTSTITAIYGDKTDTFSVTVAQTLTYIQADGASYIDTGIVHAVNTKVVLDYMSLKASGESFQCPIGSAGEDGNANYNPFYFYIGSTNNINGSMGGTGTGITGNGRLMASENPDIGSIFVNSGDRITYVLDSKNATLYLDSTSYVVTSDVNASYGNSSLALFARKHPTTIAAYAVGRIYSCKIYNNDVMIADYVPTLSNGVYGLHDKVSGAFLTNSGTGTLTGALEIADSISAVYTQSGTVYSTDSLSVLKPDLVVTAIMPDQSTRVLADADYTLSGTLTTGTSTITVSYTGKTDTFNVTVTQGPLYPFDNGSHSFTSNSRRLVVTRGSHIVYTAPNATSSTSTKGAYINLSNVTQNDTSAINVSNINKTATLFTLPNGSTVEFKISNITFTNVGSASSDNKYAFALRNNTTSEVTTGDKHKADTADITVTKTMTADTPITCVFAYLSNPFSSFEADVSLTVNGVKWI